MDKKMKIFLCSTSFDLEDLRALAVDRCGDNHEFIHFEDAAFPSRRGLHSHDQCIEAVKQADVVVCIIDRRYGGHYRGNNSAGFPEQSVKFKATVGRSLKVVEVKVPTKDLSISWCELITAFKEPKYVITFARKRTFDEKETRRKNQGIQSFKPAHVDDVRVFDLLDWITKQPKDNWIIPFDNAVDFLKKLEKWLEVADATTVPAKAEEEATLSPIVLIVEGQSDAVIAKAILSCLELRHPVSIIVAQGKRALLSNLRGYADAFSGAVGILVLADSDTEDPQEIEMQKNQFKQIASQISKPEAKLVLAVPEIETWLGKTKFKRDKTLHFNKLFEELHFMQKEFPKRLNTIPSFGDFISALMEMDKRP